MKVNDDERRMPGPVRIVLGWFILLMIGACLTLLALQGRWNGVGEMGLGWMLRMQVVCIGYVALGAGFVAAILKGRREWVTVPYALIGLVIVILLLLSEFVPPLPGSVNNNFAALLWAVTGIPVVLLYLPNASRWFAAFPTREKPGVGCYVLVILAIAGMITYIADAAAESVRKADFRNLSFTSMRGRNVFQMWRMNEFARDDGAQGVEVAACTNSCELVAELCACFEKDTGLAAWAKEWSFAVNLPEWTPNSFPVMITANVDPAELPREWDGKTDKDKQLKLKPIEGTEPLSFGNRAVVVVRNDGRVEVVKRRRLTLGTIFGNEPFKLGEDTYFLTPVGKRNAGGK